ncbi:hypothetical protein KP509_04G002200 [Ceratopteris richardii]|uniref:Uncharacterized protein n=1 Tax=Ceratopteris richardii TaxID=49495 RepID=A0A8T2UPS9_CERRI|nr:hypothetical protein KP509_04G002200 [Ceratopteris richardii]
MAESLRKSITVSCLSRNVTHLVTSTYSYAESGYRSSSFINYIRLDVIVDMDLLNLNSKVYMNRDSVQGLQAGTLKLMVEENCFIFWAGIHFSFIPSRKTKSCETRDYF